MNPRSVALAAALLTFASAPALAGDPTFSPTDVPTAFFIAKSQNANRVDYGLHLDAECRPDDAPLFAYWRMFARTPFRLEGLNFIERFVYGIGKQQILRRDATGAALVVRLKKLPRDVTITIARDAEGHCAAVSRMRIGAVEDAVLSSAFVQLKGFNSVDYVELRGADPRTGEPIAERVKP